MWSLSSPLQRSGGGRVMAEEPFLLQQQWERSPESIAVPGSGTWLAPGRQRQRLQGHCTPLPSLGACSCLLLGTPLQCWACGTAPWLPRTLPAPP